MDSHPKVYSILAVGGTYHLIMSENLQVFMGDL